MKGGHTLKPLKKVNNEIQKIESQIELLQTRLTHLKEQRTQLENAEMIAAIRNANFNADDMLAVIQAVKNGGTDLATLLAMSTTAPTQTDESEENENA